MKKDQLLEKAANRIKALKEQLKAYEEKDDPIAIISTACRFPGHSNTPQEFWQTLIEGKDPIQNVSPERWPETALPEEIKKKYPGTQWAGLIDDIDKFDADFFGIGGVEAKSMDPQQRILLEVSWEAFERAGLRAQDLSKSPTGVFIGMVGLDYKYRIENQPAHELDIYAATGNALCTTSGRLSYVFGLEGPSMTIETACSSSLVAVHQACLSLRAGDCNLALVGGTNFILSPKAMSLIGVTGALSPDGQCRTFDSSANGFVRSEGCGVILLKRLSDARQDNDNILGIIKGSSVNQDGRSTGFTAPNVLSQQRLLKKALRNADISPSSISYIETHGTGTSLGDPIETETIKAVFADRSKNNPCVLGGVKSNIGHLEAAAGIAGLIKITLMFQHEKIPPQRHFQHINPGIDLDNDLFPIASETKDWKREDRKRIAGISSFGFSGTNAHIIVEEGDPKLRAATGATEKEQTLLLSGRSPQAVVDLAKKYSNTLNDKLKPEPLHLSEICKAASRRTPHEYRAAVIGSSHENMLEELSALTLQDVTRVKGPLNNLVFCFLNNESNISDLILPQKSDCEALYSHLEECETILKDMVDVGFLENHGQKKCSNTSHSHDLNSLVFNFIQLSMAKTLLSWKITPDVIVADGIGSIVAKYIKQSLSFEQAVKAMIISSDWYLKLHDHKTPELAREITDEIQPCLTNEPSQSQNHIKLHCPTINYGERLLKKDLGTFSPHVIMKCLEDYVGTQSESSKVFNFGHICQHSLINVFEDTTHLDECLNRILGDLYIYGYPIDFKLVYPEASGWELLPTYPWQHESYWISESYETLTAAHPSQPSPKELTTTQEKPSDLLGTVTSAVADILGIPSERVRTEQHMFEIGMDSISAVRLINDLKKKHGIAFTLPDLLREENIEQLVQWLEMNPSNTHEVESVSSLSDEEWDTDFIDQISESDVRALEEVIRKESLQ